jgi:HK97 family phage major capsid protein
MKVKDYLGQMVDEEVAKRLDEMRKREAQDHVIGRRKDKVSSDDRELASKFYKALSTGKEAPLAEVSEHITKQWKEKAQSEGTPGTGTGGGVLVPTTVADSIVSQMLYISPMRQISTVIENMPAQMELPSEATLATAYWVSEGASGTDSGEVFAPNILTPFKAAGLDGFTSEILADAATNPSIQNYVESRFAIAMALLENMAFVNGSGSGQPWGFRSSAITPASVAQTNDTLGYSDVVNLKYALPTAYRQMAVFVGPSAAFQALENVKDNYGRPIWHNGLAEGTPNTLLGRPAYVVDEIPSNLGGNSNATELWFGYFKGGYFIGDRGALRIDYGTNGTDFANDKISLRVLKRVAGRPILSQAFAKLTSVVTGS